MPVNVQKEERRLKGMTVPELRVEYTTLYGETTQSTSKPFLIKRILWRMQCNEYGDISERARKRALEIANDADLRLRAPVAYKKQSIDETPRTQTKPVTFTHDSRTPAVGRVITRLYKGQQIEVTVELDGFSCNGKKYGSLSAIASEITGCHQNGFRFFKLNKGA